MAVACALRLAVGLIEPVVQTAAFAIDERALARVELRLAAQALVSSEPPAVASAPA